MKIDVDTLPKSSKDALALGSKFYFTGQPCAHGHVCMRRAINHACLECVEIRTHTAEHKCKRAERYRNCCNRPDVVKKRKDYYLLHRSSILERHREYYQRHRAARRAKDAEYYKTHRDAILAQTGRWVKAHPDKYRATQRIAQARRRAVKIAAAGGDVMEAKKFKKWVDAQPKVCFYCGVECSSAFHVDHFIPLSKGGTHSANNLRIACRHCNLTKNASDPYQFMYKSYSATLALLAILSNS